MGNKQSKVRKKHCKVSPWNRMYNPPSDLLYSAIQCIKINQLQYVIATKIRLDEKSGLYLWNIQTGDVTLTTNYYCEHSSTFFGAKFHSICYDKIRHTLYCLIRKWIFDEQQNEYQLISFDLKIKEFENTIIKKMSGHPDL